VTEAMIDLVLEGHAPPTAEQVAARAGVSMASLFRYFETLDELRQETILHYLDRYAELFEIPAIGEGSLDERIDRLVAARVRLYENTEPMARFVRARAPEVPDLDAVLHRSRRMRAEQLRRHFAPELDPLTPARRDDLVALLCVVTSFESWLQLRDDHGRSTAQTRRTWTRAIEGLLSPD
jgi:AcrR family transcriptional regulator